MSDIRFDRLLKLAEWLEQPQEKLGHDRFFFGHWHIAPGDIDNELREEIELPENFCGSLGCAIGEAPFAHPEDWELSGAFIYGFFPKLRFEEGIDPEKQAGMYYGLDVDQTQHLFIPSVDEDTYQVPELFGGQVLEQLATKSQVAANIRAFCEKMQSEQTLQGGEGQDV